MSRWTLSWTCLVIGVFCCYMKWKSWQYDGLHGFFEVSGHFGKDYDAFSAETEAWWSMDFPAGHPSQSIHPNLLKFGSGISQCSVECSWMACSVFKFKSHGKYLVEFKENSDNIKKKIISNLEAFSSEELATIAVERWHKLLSTYRQCLMVIK